MNGKIKNGENKQSTCSIDWSIFFAKSAISSLSTTPDAVIIPEPKKLFNVLDFGVKNKFR